MLRKQTHPQLYLLRQAQKHAVKKGLEFSITIDDINIPLECPYLSEPLTFNFNRGSYGVSIDRVDSSKGYIKGNIQIISSLANTMKNNASEIELIKFAEGVLRLHGGTKPNPAPS